MRRWGPIAILVLAGLCLMPMLFGLFCLVFLPRHDIWVRMQFPRGFRGPALIAFDEPSGRPLHWEGDVLRLDFPPSGVLKVRDRMDAFPTSWQPAYAWDDGQPMPVPMNDGTGRIDPRTENVVSVHGGDDLDNKFTHFFVGTDREFRSAPALSGGLHEQYEADVARVRKADP